MWARMRNTQTLTFHCAWYNYFGKLEISTKSKNIHTVCLAIPHLGIYLEEIDIVSTYIH